jgi:protein-S-isoprenylcysteine O-methyltransferase Ste14
MKEIKNIIIMALVGILVLFGVFFYILGSVNFDLGDIILIVIPIILVIGVMVIIWDKIKNLRAGLPSEDERAKKLNWKAGAYSYFATIWISVGLMWYNIFAENLNLYILNVGQVIGAIILLSALCFFIFNFYFMRKGDVE